MTRATARDGRGPAPDARLVSVVMSVHNGLPYLGAAVRSVLGQTYPNLEFIFVDDGSTDGSREALRGFAAEDGRIRLIEQANTGLTRALNRAIGMARGPYVARMDADDISFPQRVARQVEALEGDPSAVAASCFIDLIDEAGRVTDTTRRRCPPALVRWHLLFFNYVGGHSQVVFRKAAFERVGGYDEAFRYSQDYDLWSRLSGLGGFVIVDEVLHQYRVHRAGVSVARYDAQFALGLQVTRRGCEAVLGRPPGPAEVAILRRFWDSGGGPPLTRAEQTMVVPLLGEAYRAFIAATACPAASRAALRSAIGQRWMFWGEAITLSQTRVVAACFVEAIRWSPRLAPTIAGRLRRRLALHAGRGARGMARVRLG